MDDEPVSTERPAGDAPPPAPGGRARRWVAPLVAGILAAGAAFAAGVALTGDDGRAGATASPAAGASAGNAVFARMACGGCHTLAAANSNGQIGPNLDERLPGHTAASLRAKIVDPYAGTPASFYAMPRNFGERLSDGELDELVAFLLYARDQP